MSVRSMDDRTLVEAFIRARAIIDRIESDTAFRKTLGKARAFVTRLRIKMIEVEMKRRGLEIVSYEYLDDEPETGRSSVYESPICLN